MILFNIEEASYDSHLYICVQYSEQYRVHNSLYKSVQDNVKYVLEETRRVHALTSMYLCIKTCSTLSKVYRGRKESAIQPTRKPATFAFLWSLV